MTDLSFGAVILTGKSTAGKENAETGALQRSVEIFYDMGVEDIVILAPAGAEGPWRSHPVLVADSPLDPWTMIGAAAQSAQGTHLLVLDSEIQGMDPVFFVRLMQMSCLGMGVVPFVRGIPKPLAACYPAAISVLEAFAGKKAGPEAMALEALGKGLVARYDVAPKDTVFFEKFPVGAESFHFSNR